MEQTERVVILPVELVAAKKQARRTLSKYSLEDDNLEELLAISNALTSKGWSEQDALEAGSGVAKNGHSPERVVNANLDSFLSLVSSDPDLAGGYIAGLHDLLSSRATTIPVVSVESKSYSRGLISKPKIIGLEEQVKEVSWCVEQLFCYKNYFNPELDAMYSGILLYGPPGTGKTSLCKHAIAYSQELSSQLEISFSYTIFSPTDYGMYVGESARNLRTKLSKISDPSGVGILVIDDIDMVVQSRDDQNPNHGFLQVTAELMQFMSGMDDFNGNYLVMACSNKPEKIDSALERRFELQLEVPAYSKIEEFREYVSFKMPWASESQKQEMAQYGFVNNLTPAYLDRGIKTAYRWHLGRPNLPLTGDKK